MTGTRYVCRSLVVNFTAKSLSTSSEYTFVLASIAMRVRGVSEVGVKGVVVRGEGFVKWGRITGSYRGSGSCGGAKKGGGS